MKSMLVAAAVGMIAPAAMADVFVGVDQSDANWLGYMNVFELDANGGGFVFGSSWGVADLSVSFDDANNNLSFLPNSIGDPNEFWYQDPTGMGNPNPGGPGAPGNKVMEANMFQQVDDGSLSGETVVFQGNVLSMTLTDAHDATVFIRDFAADFSSFNESSMAIDSSGSFSISLDTIDDVTRHVQWGIQVKGVNVWVTDLAPFGRVVVETVPAPGAVALLGMGGLLAGRRRRS